MAGSKTRFLCQKLVYLIHSVSVYLRPILCFICNYVFRVGGHGGGSLNKNGNNTIFLELLTENKRADKDATGFGDNDEDDGLEEDKSEVYLKFKFPTYEEFRQIQKETGNNTFNSQVVPSASTEFESGKSFITTFIDEMETFPLEKGNDAGDGIGNCSVNEVGFCGRDLEELCNDETEEKGLRRIHEFDDNHKNVSEEVSVVNDSDSETMSFEHLRSVMNRLVDSYSDGFLSDGDFGVGEEFDINGEDEKTESESDGFSDEDSDIMEELNKLEEQDDDLENPDGSSSDFLCERDFNEDFGNVNDAEFLTKDDEGVNDGDNDEKSRLKDSATSDSSDGNKLESLWEHQELIEQLKLELKKVRATGLPTILEESESPKIMDDLKPWRIDEFKREDCVGEVHKFYKSYIERMRKFDIINYQKMYAMGFLQLKDPLPSTSKQKPSPPTLKSLVSQNLWLFKHKIHGSDPMKKFIMELRGDLEGVYVGQMCLSWEFLHWQYEKALDLWDSDPRGIRRYNEVAGEFQQFQVLIQRFIEDEPFQGPRVQNYVKTRCAVRNLLQVPIIREDKLKDKRKINREDTVITSDMLVEMVEESIRIFWRFVRADKDSTTPSVRKMACLLSPEEDTNLLLVEVKKTLQKKQRKVRDLMRGENCILRKFRQCREDDKDDDVGSDEVVYFFAQVDMKLVRRVVNMSKISRDQLMWCVNKLNRIKFVNRKVKVEPAFLLFPC